MKLSIRTLDQKTLSVDINQKYNVLQLKQTLSSMAEVKLPVESLQLIYAGRIMKDEDPLSEYNIEEGKLIVLMGKRKIETAPAKTPESSVPSTPRLSVILSNSNLATAQAEPPTPSLAPNEIRVRQLMDLGYEETEVRAALRASYNHPERAIEYLINGIPPYLNVAAETATAAPNVADNNAATAAGEQQRFQDMHELFRQNPQMMAALMARLRQQQEQEAPIDAESSSSDEVTLSAEETASVNRLVDLGFARNLVMQVYLACDKNEALTADILFQEYEDDEG